MSGVPDAVWEEEWQRQLLEKALKLLKQQVEPKQFQIFDCYVFKEWPVKEVAETFHVTANQIYSHQASAVCVAGQKGQETGGGVGTAGDYRTAQRVNQSSFCRQWSVR